MNRSSRFAGSGRSGKHKAGPLEGGSGLRYAVYAAFLFAVFLGGGGSRDDILSLLYVRPVAIVSAAMILAIPGPFDFRSIRVPFWLLIGFALLMIVQLIPLPPEVWMALPGRDVLADGASLFAVEQPWRPLTMAPDLTYNSLASTVVPMAALLGFAALTPVQRESLVPLLAAAACVSAIVAVLQLSAGPNSILYGYRVTNEGGAVGLFANRNHQAVLLALALPMLATWAAGARGDHQRRIVTRTLAAGGAMILLVMLLVTGSRAGLVLGGIGAIWSIFQYLELRRSRRGVLGSGRSLAVAVAAVAIVGGLLAYLTFGRAQSLQRLIGQDLQAESRLQKLPYLWEMARDHLPFGTGLGTFDPVYRIHEPLEFLSPSYLNHAHNDLVELTMTGGLPALGLLLVFILWWAWKSWQGFRSRTPLATLGSVVILMIMLGSLVDYPVRTPILATVLAIACGWLGLAGRGRDVPADADGASLRSNR